MPTIEQIRFVLEIAKANSISQAAKNLYTSQPYLSTVLKELEQELNVCLFERNNKGVTPTQQGILFMEYAEELLASMQRIETLQYDAAISNATSLKIVNPYALIMHDIFTQFYNTYREKHWQLFYMECHNNKIIEEVATNQADIGILHFDSKYRKQQHLLYASNHLKFYPLHCENTCVLVGKNHPLFHKESIKLNELKHFSLATSKNTQPSIIKRFFNNRQVQLAPMTFDNNRNLIHYISQSATCFTFGIPILNMNDPLLKAGNIKYLKMSDLQCKIQIGYLLREDKEKNEALEAYTSYLKLFFQSINQENT